jgi:hypothetical protein
VALTATRTLDDGTFEIKLTWTGEDAHCGLDAAPAGTLLARVDPRTNAVLGRDIRLAVGPEARFSSTRRPSWRSFSA